MATALDVCPHTNKTCRYIPVFSQPRGRTSPGWEYYATPTPKFPWQCVDCDHFATMTHDEAVNRGLAWLDRNDDGVSE